MSTISNDRQIFSKVQVGRTDGITFEDISKYVTMIDIENGDVSSVGTGQTGADDVARTATITLLNDSEVGSFSPRVQDSYWNQFGGEYSPLLFPVRAVYVRAAILADQELGSTTKFGDLIGVGDGSTTIFQLPIYPILDGNYQVYLDGTVSSASIDADTGVVTFASPPPFGIEITVDYIYYRTIFSGYMDKPKITSNTVTVFCRDGGKRLMDTYIEVPKVYGSESGVQAEIVMQEILDDNGLDDIVIDVPVSPNFLVKPTEIKYKSVRDALVDIANNFGWYIGFRYKPAVNDFVLTLLEPPRDKDELTADYNLSAENEDIYVQDLDISDQSVRNVVRMGYFDTVKGETVTLDPDDPLYAPYLKDQPSIDQYFRRAMEIIENDTSLVDTEAEALSLGAAVLQDLKDLQTDSVITMPLFLDIDTFSGINMENGLVSSTIDFFGVHSVSHTLNFGEDYSFRTRVVGSGKVIGGRQKWLKMQSRPGAGEPILGQQILNLNSSVIVAANDTPLDRKKLADFICDGIDDQVQIQAAIDSLPAGGLVTPLEGTYSISGPILLKNNIRINGTGSTILKIVDNAQPATGSFGIFRSGSADVNNDKIVMSNLILDGNKANNTIDLYGILFFDGTNFEIQNCVIKNHTKSGIGMNAAGNLSQITITSCAIHNNDDFGIIVFNTVPNCIISNNKIYNNGTGMAIRSEITVSNNQIIDNLGNGVTLVNNNNILVSNNISNNGRTGVTVSGVDNTLSQNTLTGNGSTANNAYAAIRVDGDDNNIQNNQCRLGLNPNKPSTGILITLGASRNLISNNDCYQSGITAGIADSGTGTIFGAGNINNDGTFSTTPN